jgi:uncharacterized protein (DUF39 family)
LKTVGEINEKIKTGRAVVLTAEEVIAMVKEQGVKEAVKKVDVVTTGTFSPMCSSGAFLNFGHGEPLIRMSGVTLNDVPAYAGIAAVDCFIGATELSSTQGMSYGGAHVIEDLIAGREVRLSAKSYGTDCYPRKEVETVLTLKDMNQCFMFNPRNAYQNYSAAANTSDKVIHTYMGTLLPRCANVTYATSGELSPLLKDPELRSIGIGTRVFFGGTEGYVAWEGTQCFPSSGEYSDGSKSFGGATLALIGDLKKMSTDYIRAACIYKYGVSLYVGVGIPFPVLDEDFLLQLAATNRELFTEVYDYSVPLRKRPVLREKVSYAELRSGEIELGGKRVPTAPMSSLKKAREIAQELKTRVAAGTFLLSEPVAPLQLDTVKKILKEVR